jgi:hypothetical protein
MDDVTSAFSTTEHRDRRGQSAAVDGLVPRAALLCLTPHLMVCRTSIALLMPLKTATRVPCQCQQVVGVIPGRQGGADRLPDAGIGVVAEGAANAWRSLAGVIGQS